MAPSFKPGYPIPGVYPVPHEQWLAGLRGAPQDVSLPILEDLLSQGYADTDWETNTAAQDAPCIAKDGDKQPLADFISGLQHAAPVFEKTHVGCKCTIKVTGPGLPEVRVTAFGMEQGSEPEAPLSEEPVPASEEAPPAEPEAPAEPPAEPTPEPEEKPEAEGEAAPEAGEDVPPKETT